jgi:hypothetical protein
MRNAVGVFGLVCGLIVVALVGRYGFKTTDLEADAWIMAFLFAVIAAFGIAAVVELIILICLIGWEVLGHAPAGSPTMGAPVAQTEPEPVTVKIAPPRPTLVASRKEAPAGPIRRIMHDVLEPARGRRVELGQGYLRYTAICKAEGRTPVTPDQYMDAMVGFCKVTGIRTKIEGNRIYLMGEQLAALPAKAGSLAQDEEAAHA